MDPGIFAKVFPRPSLRGTLEAVAAHGIGWIQFNFSVAGLETLPGKLHPDTLDEINEIKDELGIKIAAVSGTFNMIDPDRRARRRGLERLRVLAAAARALDAPVITLCSGSRDPESMWRWHPGNGTSDAWQDLVASMQDAVSVARGTGVRLAVEPEPANVVYNAKTARRLLNEINDPHLGVVIDPANLLVDAPASSRGKVIEEAFRLLGNEIVLAHAKDLPANGNDDFVPAGRGVVDYDLSIRCLREVAYEGPLILHSLHEADVEECLAFLAKKLSTASPAGRG